jgi:hypothetical protein
MIKPNFVDTIIIKSDPFSVERGYSILGREFKLKFRDPIQDAALTLDKAEIVDWYYVVDLKEYVRVVPESRNDTFISETVYIPTFAAMKSLKPEYLK